MENIQYGIALEAAASKLTQGAHGDGRKIFFNKKSLLSFFLISLFFSYPSMAMGDDDEKPISFSRKSINSNGKSNIELDNYNNKKFTNANDEELEINEGLIVNNQAPQRCFQQGSCKPLASKVVRFIAFACTTVAAGFDASDIFGSDTKTKTLVSLGLSLTTALLIGLDNFCLR